MNPLVSYIAASSSHQASTISWHQHEHHEIVMLLQGASGWEFPTGEELRLKGDEFKIVPPYVMHRGLQDIRNPSSLCVVGFRPAEAAKGRTLFTPQDAEWLKDRFTLQNPAVQPMSVELRRAAKALHRAITQYSVEQFNPSAAATLRMLVVNILLEVATQQHHTPDQEDAHTVSLALNLMESHFAEPLQVDEIARQIGCSRTRLFSVFKHQQGMSPNDWLQRLRIQKTQHLLTTSNRTLDDIAQSCGFATSAYFCTVFKKYTGLTPGAYRQEQSTPAS